MTKALDKAFKELTKLSPERQDEIARLILEDLLWDKDLEKDKEKLTLMASDAIEEYKRGETIPFNS